MSNLKVFENKDKMFVEQMRKALKKNDGYCPCKLEKNINTKCMCKEFREQGTPGYCHCGLYYKEIDGRNEGT